MARWQPAERDARYRKRRRLRFPTAVSEGDSWFDYPLFLNLIDRLDDAGLFAHLRLEFSGDTAAGMIGSAAARANLRTVVDEARPLVVLFSGGGNDLAGAARRLLQPASGTDPETYLVADEVDDFFDTLRSHYVAMIDAIGPVAPIFAHGYDYFAPSASPVRLNGVSVKIGPWIYPRMLQLGIDDEATRRAIARLLVDRFAEMLAALEVDHPLDFVHVDLRGTLDIDADWANEIHPTSGGFRKVADAFRDVLVARLPGLQGDRVARDLVVA